MLRAKDILEKTEGTTHTITAESYHQLSACYYQLKNYSAALDYANKALKAATASFGPNHKFTKQVKSNVESLKAHLKRK